MDEHDHKRSVSDAGICMLSTTDEIGTLISTCDAAAQPEKKRRTLLTTQDKQLLEREFAKDRFPSKSVKDKIARDLNKLDSNRKVLITPRIVQVWFQNRRDRKRFPSAPQDVPKVEFTDPLMPDISATRTQVEVMYEFLAPARVTPILSLMDAAIAYQYCCFLFRCLTPPFTPRVSPGPIPYSSSITNVQTPVTAESTFTIEELEALLS
jgi:hypothetical protein